MEDATPHAISKTNKSHQSALPNGLIGDLWFAAADAAWSGANQLSLLLSNQTNSFFSLKRWIVDWICLLLAAAGLTALILLLFWFHSTPWNQIKKKKWLAHPPMKQQQIKKLYFLIWLDCFLGAAKLFNKGNSINQLILKSWLWMNFSLLIEQRHVRLLVSRHFIH